MVTLNAPCPNRGVTKTGSPYLVCSCSNSPCVAVAIAPACRFFQSKAPSSEAPEYVLPYMMLPLQEAGTSNHRSGGKNTGSTRTLQTIKVDGSRPHWFDNERWPGRERKDLERRFWCQTLPMPFGSAGTSS